MSLEATHLNVITSVGKEGNGLENANIVIILRTSFLLHRQSLGFIGEMS